MDLLTGIWKFVKSLLLFSEPEEVEGFTLKERPCESGKDPYDVKEADVCKKGKNENNKPPSGKDEISSKLPENLEFIKSAYTIPDNGDVLVREFDIVVRGKVIPAFIVFIDGMVDRKVINDDILQPLMLLSNMDIKGDEKNIAEYVRSHILPHNQIHEVREHKKVIDEVNFGGCGIYIDGVNSAFAADVKGWEHRNVERPNTELVIRGPQEGFNESLRVNTALVRKRLKDEKLVAESLEIGLRSKTPISLLYIKDIANESLVKEVRRRLKGIKVDYVMDTGELEQFIEDSTFLPSPQIIATERPDRTASALSEGRVAVIMNGSPFALVMPVTYTDLFHSPEDNYIRFPYANLLRFIRLIGIFFSLLLPGIYLAITNFHHEMIPTDLLLAIEASREKVPFPSVVEIMMMEIAFELIREAGIRIPGPIGPTLGIIGALILGQAAVAANIVSPILIIIVAVTGIGSFALPNFSLAFAFRSLRFAYIFLGAMAGLLGITAGLFIHLMWLVSAKSFGVPFFAPFGPKTAGGLAEQLTKMPIWMQENRPDFMNSRKINKQRKISRAWTKSKDGEGDSDGK